MSDMVQSLIQLYGEAIHATGRSFVRCWIIAIAVVIFALLMVVAAMVASSLGMVGGFLLGAVNALLVGAMLSLIEEAVKSSRRLGLQDIWSSFGHYFWDVIGVGFIFWLPLMLLERGMAANPYGPMLTSGVFLLLFIILNPAPEVIYQVRHDSPLEVIRESYEFIIENWIEWFLPLAVILAPFGLTFFFVLSSRVGGSVGLNFLELFLLPGTILMNVLSYLGLSGGAGQMFILLLTPPLMVLMLMFRGHLFAGLHGSSRRQRLFKSRGLGRDD